MEYLHQQHNTYMFLFTALQTQPSSTLFPYPTLFRSTGRRAEAEALAAAFPPARSFWIYGGLGDKERAFEARSEEHTSELQSQSNLVCRLLLEKKKKRNIFVICSKDT